MSVHPTFDRHLDRFGAYQATPWGRLRYTIVAANLARHLPNRPLTVLDVGGGNGLDAVALALLGHRVTIVDTAEKSMQVALTTAAEQGVGDRIAVHCADVMDIPSRFADHPVDLILAHNLLPYIDDRPAALSAMASVMRPSGMISVLGPNPRADPMITAVRHCDIDEALRLLDSPTRHVDTYGTDIPAVDADEIVDGLQDVGLNMLSHYGVRVVCDLIADDAVKFDADFYSRLEQLELALADRLPYRRLARFFHVIAEKPIAGKTLGKEVTG